MSARITSIIILAMATLFALGCSRTAGVYNVEDESVIVGKSVYTMEDVKKAILIAGAGLGWSITQVAPGELEGVLHLRTHMAKVEIPYSMESYSILYLDSENLKYDGTNIHGNYNGWIQNLDRAIKVHLSAIQ